MFQVSLPVFIAIWTTIVVVIIVTLGIIIKTIRRNRSLPLDKDYIANKEANIKKLLQGFSSTEYSMAVIEADKLLDYFLKQRNFPGETLGERLKMACYNNKELKKVWPSHILRNKIVHEHDIELTYKEAEKCWQAYKKAYKLLAK